MLLASPLPVLFTPDDLHKSPASAWEAQLWEPLLITHGPFPAWGVTKYLPIHPFASPSLGYSSYLLKGTFLERL